MLLKWCNKQAQLVLCWRWDWELLAGCVSLLYLFATGVEIMRCRRKSTCRYRVHLILVYFLFLHHFNTGMDSFLSICYAAPLVSHAVNPNSSVSTPGSMINKNESATNTSSSTGHNAEQLHLMQNSSSMQAQKHIQIPISSKGEKEEFQTQSSPLFNDVEDPEPQRNNGTELKNLQFDDDIEPPRDIIPMIALPPRDLIPGSTKGMPYKVRILHTHRRRSGIAAINHDDDVPNEGFAVNGIVSWMRRKLLTFETLTKRAIYNVDLHGGIVGVGEYFSYIEIGGKSIRVQIDTGSSTLAVPMKGCSSCINKVNRYEVETSTNGYTISCDSSECASDRCTTNCPVCSDRGACCSTERPSECGFSLRYADGSAASGSVVRDEMQWGSHLRVNVTFGGILRNSPNFERPEVDGILGMAFKSLACNPSCFDPPFDALVNAGLLHDVFSICMTSTGGKLMLGGFDKRVAKSRVEYVRLSHSGTERYYRVTLDGKLGIAGKSVNIPDFHTAIVDTGTTLIVTSTRAFAAIKEQLQRNFCDVPELCTPDSWFQSGMCVNLGDEELALMPTLTFTVGGDVEVTLRPQDYMLSYRRGRRQYRCVGIMGMDGLGGMVVLGNTLMQRYVTVYDRKNGRIGFALAAPMCGD